MTNKLATTQGKEFAQKALAIRRAQFKDAKPIDNSMSPAYAPMYFMCKGCGDPQGITVPEAYLSKPDLCEDCSALRAMGWLE